MHYLREIRNVIKILLGEPYRKTPLERKNHSWDDKVLTDLGLIVCGMGFSVRAGPVADFYNKLVNLWAEYDGILR